MDSRAAPTTDASRGVKAQHVRLGETVEGLSSAEARRRLASVGPNTTPPEHRHPFVRFLSRFWGPVPWLIEAAFVAELLLRNTGQAVILAALLAFNGGVGWFQEGRAQRALDLLTTRLSSVARVRRDGAWQEIPAAELVPGDLAHMRAGDTVPADATIVSGHVLLDQSAITGESAPVEAARGDEALSGSIVRRGEADIYVRETGPRTRLGKAWMVVSTGGERSQMAGVVFRIVRALGAAVVILALVAFVAGYVVYAVSVSGLISFCLSLLVASIPAALPAAFALSAALGARDLAARGVLVTRLSAIEDAASMDVLCSDKTGTLTANRLSVSTVIPLEEAPADDVLRYAALASDPATQDPLDVAVFAAAPTGERLERLEFVGFDPSTRRSEALVREDGRLVRVFKGAPNTLAALAGAPEPIDKVNAIAATGARVLAVATAREGESPRLLGLLGFADPPRNDSRGLVERLQALGVRVVMLTGDTPQTARSVAETVGIPGRVCVAGDAIGPGAVGCGTFASVYPEDKVAIVSGLQHEGHVVGMTGDGFNDAPALKRADVGIAVANATDAAKSAAAAVLTEPGLRNIVAAIEEGRRIYQRILTYALNKIVKTFHIALFLVGGLLLTGDFVTTSSLVLLVLIANDFATLSIATDRAEYSAGPDRWTIEPMVVASLAIAGGWVVFSLAAYLALRAIWNLTLGELQTLSFLILVLSGQLTVLLVRTRGFAWRSRPSKPLLASALSVFVVTTGLALAGALVASPPVTAIVALEAATFGFALTLDGWKVWVFRFLHVR